MKTRETQLVLNHVALNERRHDGPKMETVKIKISIGQRISANVALSKDMSAHNVHITGKTMTIKPTIP